MQLSMYPHVGTGYQSALKIHGCHLDMSSLNVDKLVSLEVNYCLSQQPVAICPKGENKK